jgi:hypothetical protein
MPGMGYLGADDAGATSTGFDWGKLFGSATEAIVKGGVAIGTQAITNRLTPSQPTVVMQAPAAQQVPTQPLYQQAAMAVPSTPKWLPYALIGGGVLVLGAIFLMKKK